MTPKAVAALICFAATAVLFINFCDLVFGCGCTWLWAGADAHCNIHAHHGKHCPWCSHGMSGYAAIFAAVLLPQLLTVWKLPRGGWLLRTVAGLTVFPLAGSVVALVVGWLDGYWVP